ncbi:hypothetical protein ONE63_008735 [Megalurothrips usitatus]|uniref:CG-1 domain-containing protein n=1 Tax=Megalurothrips usitatus TaxID=439358 RepID=A0AAV7XQP1_9NEOP|nr:hypothetical protein ONE63_008735 [Megalurothrips usitatus]
MLLYSRKKVRYRRDGYCWKKRKDGKTTREDHMKLKVQGTECIYGCYVHSAILPTFHRRCYWLLQNPDIVLVHYLNVPYPDDNKMVAISPSLALWGDKKEWTKEELVSQLKPMCESLGRVPRGAHHRPSHHQIHPFSNSGSSLNTTILLLSLSTTASFLSIILFFFFLNITIIFIIIIFFTFVLYNMPFFFLGKHIFATLLYHSTDILSRYYFPDYHRVRVMAFGKQ